MHVQELTFFLRDIFDIYKMVSFQDLTVDEKINATISDIDPLLKIQLLIS